MLPQGRRAGRLREGRRSAAGLAGLRRAHGPLLARPGPLRRHQRLREGQPPHRWPYRDWVINAFNRNMPFDQFTIEQIAGDLLPDATPEQKIATGFHRNTMVNTEGGADDEEFRVAAVVDRVNTTMTVWMGTTTCAQCHDHKFDPFTQKEFYQLFAFFNSTEDHGRSNDPEIPLPTPEQAARIKALRDGAAAMKAAANLTGPSAAPAPGGPAAGHGDGEAGGGHQAGHDAGDAGTAAAAADAHHAPRQLPQPRRRGEARRAGQLHPLPPGRRQPARPGALAGRPQQSADGPRDHEPHVGRTSAGASSRRARISAPRANRRPTPNCSTGWPSSS